MAIWIGWTPKGGKAVGADPFPPFGWKPSNFWDKRSRDYLNWRIGSPSTVECSWCTEGQYGTPFLGSLQFSTILKVDMLGDILVVLSDFGQLRRRSSLTVELVFLRSSSHSTSPLLLQRKVLPESFCFDIFSGVPDENTKREEADRRHSEFRIDAVDLVFCMFFVIAVCKLASLFLHMIWLYIFDSKTQKLHLEEWVRTVLTEQGWVGKWHSLSNEHNFLAKLQIIKFLAYKKRLHQMNLWLMGVSHPLAYTEACNFAALCALFGWRDCI